MISQITSQQTLRNLEPAVSKITPETTIAVAELVSNDTALTEAERMYKQGIGDNSHTDKKPA